MHSRTARFRSAAVAACMSFVALFLFLVALPFQLLGRPKHFFIHRVLRRWCQLLLKLLGIHVVVSGKEFLAAQNRIVVSNHASWLDIPILIASFPGQLRIIGKKELGSWPLVGWYIKLAGHFLLDRNNDRQGRQVIRAAAAALRTYGVSSLIFPEGTTTADGFLQKFRKGALALALWAQTDIQPVAVLGSYRILSQHESLPITTGTVEVRFGEGIPVARHLTTSELTDMVRSALINLGVAENPLRLPAQAGLVHAASEQHSP